MNINEEEIEEIAKEIFIREWAGRDCPLGLTALAETSFEAAEEFVRTRSDRRRREFEDSA